MNRRAYAIIVALALIVMFVAVNLIAAHTLKGARLDLTQDRLYTLSDGTRAILRGLNEPIELKLFYSRAAAANRPAVRAYAARVREMLQAYQAHGRDMVRIVEVDPERYTLAEDEAVRAGLAPLERAPDGEPIYLGIVGANAVDESVVAPLLAPEREPFLEYDITRLIAELEQPQRLKIALVSALALNPDNPPYWLAELTRTATVERLGADFTALPDDADFLLIVHPPTLNEAQALAIDQFVMAKGRALIAVDPAAVLAPGLAPLDPLGAPPPASSELDRLLSAWGISVSREITLDRAAALPLTAGAPPNPLFVEIPPARVAGDDLVTGALRRPINVLAAGALSWTPPAGVRVTPLLSTSTDTMRLPPGVAAAAPAPQDLLGIWRSAGRSDVIAVRVSGALPSAFARTAPLKSTAKAGQVVVIADVDFLDDRLYVGPDLTPARDNASVLLNAIDVLGGSDALVSLRSRAPSLRRLTALDDIARAALADRRASQAKLEAELTALDQRLARLRAAGGAGPDGLNAAAVAEIERFQDRAAELRSQLRAMERAARVTVEARERRVVLANVWAPPILIAAIGLIVFWLRMRRTERKARRSNP